jgi:hypothetical protein
LASSLLKKTEVPEVHDNSKIYIPFGWRLHGNCGLTNNLTACGLKDPLNFERISQGCLEQNISLKIKNASQNILRNFFVLKV